MKIESRNPFMAEIIASYRHREVLNPDRISCEAPGGCPHTAQWLTDAGFLYCQGHKYLGDAEATLATAVQAAT